MKKMWKLLFDVLFVCLVAIVSFAISDSVYADKIDTAGVFKCYGDSSAVLQSINFSSFDEYTDVIKNNGDKFVPLETKQKDGNYDNCKHLIGNLLKSKNVTSSYTMSKKDEDGRRYLLDYLGYKPLVSENGKCIVFNVNNKVGSSANPSSASQNAKLCSSDGTAEGIKVDKSKTGQQFSTDAIRFKVSGNKVIVTVSGKKTDAGSEYTEDFPLRGYIETLAKEIGDFVKANIGDCLTTTYCLDPEKPYEVTPDEISANVVYELSGDRFEVAKSVAEKLTGFSHSSFTGSEKTQLYYKYLNEFYGLSQPICDYSESSVANYESQGYRLGSFKGDDGEVKKCFVRATKNQDLTVNALNGVLFDGTRKHWWELLEEIDAISANIKPDVLPNEDGVVPGTDGEYSDKCYDAGIDGVSWIVCPMINNLTDSADEMDKTINALLYINKDDYGYGSKVEGFWKDMVKIANVAVIIVLLVIIVSQITGFGIDNYGIKKMLPKLLIMAVLINFSFVICVIAVDLSNIFGEGLNQLFSGIGSSITGGEQNNLTGLIGTLVTLAFATAGVGSLISPLGVMTVFVVLLALIAVVFGFLLFFFSLGARMMIVILCIGISPLAFACYILPNTQGLFKKWWDIFKAALLLFPICGALSGISVIMREIGSSSDNVMMMVISMISVVIPYYALPVLLKNALSALPAIGNAITGFSGAVRKGVSNASTYVKNSEAYKEAQNESARSQQYANAQRTIERINGRMRGNDPSSLSMVDQRRLARASEIVKKHGEVDDAARIALTERQFEGLSQAQVEQAWTTAVQNGDADQVRALTSVMDSNYGSNAAGFIGRYLSGVQFFDGNQFRNEQMQRSFGALQDVLRNNRSFSANMKNKSSDAFQMISSGGYTGERDATTNELIRDNNGNLLRANMDFHSAHNNVMTENKDFATQSADTLRRAAVNGGPLTQERATELLNSEDPSIRNGIASDAGKRRVLEAVAGGYTGDFGDNLAVDNAVNTYRTRVDNQVNAEDSQRQQVLTDIHDIAEQARRSNNP